MMKKLLLTTTTILALAATTAIADDFDNTSLETVVYTGNFEFSLSGDTTDGLDNIGVGYTFLHHDVGRFHGNAFAELSYGIVSEDVSIDLEYQASTYVGAFAVYGAASAEYTTPVDTIDSGDWMFTPYVGGAYMFSDNVSAYTEVGYAWNMSTDWEREGGYVEVGADFGLAENIVITPSITRTFDTANNEYQAGLTVGLSF